MSRGQNQSPLGEKPIGHKQYKLRFLKAEETQRSQWGEVDVFRRDEKTVRVMGFLKPGHDSFADFNYAELRGWKNNAVESDSG